MVNEYKDSYIVFSRTNTGIGKIIRKVTRNTYNHTSLCLDGKFYQLVSFARKHKNNPFQGGLVIETPVRYISDGEDITVKVCRIDESAFKVEDMFKRLDAVRSEENSYLYNTYGAICSPFKIKFSPYRTFTCVEFAAYILGIKGKIYSVWQLEKIFDCNKIYEGSYKTLVENYRDYFPKDDYHEKQRKRDVICGTAHHLYENAVRSFGKQSD